MIARAEKANGCSCISVDENDSPESGSSGKPSPSRLLSQELAGEGVGVKAVDERRSYHVEDAGEEQ